MNSTHQINSSLLRGVGSQTNSFRFFGVICLRVGRRWAFVLLKAVDVVEEGAVGARKLTRILESFPDCPQRPTALALFKDFILAEHEVTTILGAFGLRAGRKAFFESSQQRISPKP